MSVSGGDGGASDGGAAVELCVDTRTDDRHCGMCGRACAAGESCVGGNCQVRCAAGQTTCSGRCANVMTDPQNCGTCGMTCTGTQSCVSGVCRTGCPMGQMTCAGTCVDVQNDPRNCGACGRACTGSQVCQTGACVTRCPVSQTVCADRCVDTNTDTANCGRCGAPCSAGQLCDMGMCVNQCVMGNLLCAGRCVDTSADPRNCGSCGMSCPAGAFCSGGACMTVCAGGTTMCGASCVDTNSDNANCGACGRACAAGQSCVTGTCQALAMVDGGCSPPSQLCGGTCTDLRSSNSHCGRCGNASSADLTCVNGACVAPCAAGETRCGAAGTCTDVQRDSRNCGMCGRTCASGESCVLGACAPDPSFRMTSFSNMAASCVLSRDVQAMAAGDQGSGMVATASSVFYNGDTSTVFLPAADLSTSTAVSPMANYEQLASDLRGNVAYVMATATDGVLSYGASGTITQLRALSSMGAYTGARVMLSRPIAFSGSNYGIYSGYGRIIVYMGAGADLGYWQIEMPSGVVTRLTGAMAPSSPYTCERTGYWGIAEFFGGDHYIVYIRSAPAGIVRQRVRDGMTTVLLAADFGDACTLALSAGRNRWFAQYEAAPSWVPPAMGFGEYVVSCPATWELP